MAYVAAFHMVCPRHRHHVCLAAVKRPTVDTQRVRGERGPLPLTLGFHLGLRRQAALFAQRSETLLKQLLAGVARLCEPTGGRRVGQPQHEERLQLRRQLEQGQDHVAAAEVATCCRNELPLAYISGGLGSNF